MNTNEITWIPGNFGAILEAEVNNHTIAFYINDAEGQARPEIIVDGKFTTRNSSDWSKIDEVFPREYWPAPMFRGQKFDGKPRLAPQILVDAIEAFQAELDEIDD